MKITLATLVTLGGFATSQAKLIRYELNGVIKTYGADQTFPAGSPLLKNTFPLNTPYHASFTVDTARGVIVTNTATTRRYNRDAGANPPLSPKDISVWAKPSAPSTKAPSMRPPAVPSACKWITPQPVIPCTWSCST